MALCRLPARKTWSFQVSLPPLRRVFHNDDMGEFCPGPDLELTFNKLS
jgi:hypothetical protein